MAAEIKRVFDLLKYSLEKPKDDFVSGKIKGKWVNYSTVAFCEAVDHLSRGLISVGMAKESRVAVMSHNRPEWNITDFAINQIGAYQIPLYPTLAEHDIQFILKDAEVSIIFIADQELYEKIKPCVNEVNPDIKIYSFNEVEGVENWKVLTDLGKSAIDIDLDEYRNKVEPEDILTLIYTSGTTGTPKGVMLTHNNLVSNFVNSLVVMPNGVEKGLSFLPLSHIFERMIIYLYLYNHTAVYYAESMETIVADIQHVKPNAFSTVPRLLEKVYDKIMEKGKALTGIKRGIFFWSVALAEQYTIDAGAWYNFKLSIARKLVFKKWQEALGGEIVVIVSGGAALNPRLARIFWAAGMPVFEGYGLTETSPVITVNRFGGTMFGTVGEVITGVEVKIAPDGEVLTKGHQVMKGYYKRPDLTNEALDQDGWFHTGDIGELVEGRFLKITDRKKEMFKTAGGKYVAPQMLENKYKESIFIEQIMVLGENRKFPSALVVPNFETLKSWANKKGIAFTNPEDLIRNEQVLTKYNEVIEASNVSFGKWEQVKRFALLPKEWSIDGGELTPKLSLKRKVITEKNIDIIEKIYKDAENYKAPH
ncbi:AMP-dependent synthetase/ligase [Pedobacter sp. GR22-10]|jgi:long-chain acyl-CoA synthetase|uniref:AMP-dependent synthetase/ligase n=1 Tax=Pedobacter sp. GR22-10 TaxID=2994472 RepID=UPI0022482180|nr:long-chain fatty acid--CoA ligase [Pedobacter sp. GR22-10]MCX2433363.1 long-chain fatty acid--CoA ligase [Pedobacter sp. GR22-10]